MRDNVRAFVEVAAKSFELQGPIYEFGSYQVEGQEAVADLRTLFPGQPYIGCDMRAGPGVDRIEDLGELSLADESARTIICVDTLEHVFEARRAADELVRVLAPGGTILVTTPFEFHIHGYPNDYWRLTPACWQRLLADLDGLLVGWQGPEKRPHTVWAIGCKSPLDARYSQRVEQFITAYRQWGLEAVRRESWPHKLKRWARCRLGSRTEQNRWREYHQINLAVDVPLEEASRPVYSARSRRPCSSRQAA
jgi:SAM-dependent methyltransferase